MLLTLKEEKKARTLAAIRIQREVDDGMYHFLARSSLTALQPLLAAWPENSIGNTERGTFCR